MELTTSDIETLMKALDALKNEDTTTELLASTMMIMMAPERHKEIMDKSQQRFEALDNKKKVLEECIILLKAKLIQMKDKAIVEEMERSLA